MAVYDSGSFFEHSCRANCSKSFTENGGIIIRAAFPISKGIYILSIFYFINYKNKKIIIGEHLTICYTDPLWGVINRRHHLLRTKFFECTCQRCIDPTEFKTMFNALLCSKR